MTSGTGTCTVRYDQAGNANYNAAPQVTESVNAQKADQTITVTHARAGERRLQHELRRRGDARRAAPVTLLERRRLLEHRRHLHDDERHRHLHRSGTTRPATRNYNAAPQVTESVTAHEGEPDDHRHARTRRRAPSSTRASRSRRRGGGSGNPVTFSSSGACSNSGRHVHDDERHRHLHRQVRPGRRRELQRRAAGHRDGQRAEGEPDDHRHARTRRRAPSSTRSFTVAATGGGSGNAVTFSSSGACSNTGATFTMTSGTGTCSVKYDQAGDANYNAAPQVTETVNVAEGRPDDHRHHARAGERRLQHELRASRRPAAARATPVTFSSSGACSNTGATFTMTSGTGTCTRQVRPGRRRQLQPGSAGHRDGERAEGRPDDHRHDARAGERPSSTPASPSRRPAAARATRSPSRAAAPARTPAPPSR